MRTSNSRKLFSKLTRNKQAKATEASSKPKAKSKKNNVSEGKRFSLAPVSESLATRPVVMRAPIPENEAARLECLQKNQILNSDPAELFDDLAHLAATICIASYALISLVEKDYIWCKSMIGLTSYESMPREGSFDAWAINGTDVFVVEDAAQDVRFNFHPFVTSHPRIRFYAAAPLITSDGHALGTLCVMDWRPRPLKPFQAKALKTLAQDVVSQIELRRKNRELEQAIAERDHMVTAFTQPQVAESQELVVFQEPLPHAETLIDEPTEQVITPEIVQEAETLDSYSNDGLWEWELITNKMNYSKKWKTTLGYEETEIGTSPNEWFNRVHPEDAEKLHASILNHLSGQTPCFKSEHRILGGDGVYQWVQSRGQIVLDETGKPGSIFGSLTGLGTSKEMEDRFKHNAYHDGLTGLPNRTMFLKRLKRMQDRCQRGDSNHFALMIFDIDRFKTVNDTYGHSIGDQLLVAFSRTLKSSLRPEDVVARLGSDEFAVILDNLRDANEAIIAADRIKEAFAEHYNIEGNELFVSTCVGIAHSQYQCEQPEDLFSNAEAALIRAKEQGRDGCEFFDSEMFGRIAAHTRVEHGLTKAIQGNEFAIHYQPIISLMSYQIIGFEALLRWQHPKQGLIMPNEFIPIAEETGQIVQVDNWVLAEAARQVRRWQLEFPSGNPLSVSVNISGRRFLQRDLADYIKEILSETGANPECLKLEITESAVIENIDNATETLKKIKDLGVQVSLDDFGKGYSSLNYLQQFPVDALKLDHSFISTMDTPKNLQIVNSVMSLANSLGLKVVAEGVETGEQIIQLSGMNCQYVQGFLFSKPLPSMAATALLAETNSLTMKAVS